MMHYSFVRRFSVRCRSYSTVFALSSGLGKSGVAVIRISGKNSALVIQRMTKSGEMPLPKKASLKTIYDPSTNEPLDKGIMLWFPGPSSFTGEDVCELHVHGSKAVIQAVLSALSKLKNFRPAEPGEFTKRAFYAGKFDLTEVEGLSDLIDAETEMQRKQALYQMEGSLRNVYLTWRNSILKNLSCIEAYIDFSEDENLDESILSTVTRDVEKLRHSLQEHLNDFRRGEILRDGIKTVIIGSPNVGKSSLLNFLCKRPAAIVTEIAGTTRDVLENAINVSGYPVVITDTAGIRNRGVRNAVEKEGIRRSMNEADLADVLLLLLDAQHLQRTIDHTRLNDDQFFSYCESYQEKLGIRKMMNKTCSVLIFNKIDLLREPLKRALKEMTKNRANFIFISCKTGEGMSEFMRNMSECFHRLCGMPSRENPSCTRARHRHHLQRSLFHINQFLDMIHEATEEDILFAAEELRSAAKHLGNITGAVVTEEIIDMIFKNFCIGK